MSSSDYHFGYVYQQRHAELLQEAAERRLARAATTPARRRLADWWHGLVSGRTPRPATVRRQPVRLQSARS